MPFESIREYIDRLEDIGQLRHVKSKVSSDLEIGEILRRLVYKQGPSVLFENVDNYKMKVLGNAFGSIKRMEIALEMKRFEEIGERIVGLTRMEIPTSMIDKIKMLPKLSEITEYAPKTVNKGTVMENIGKANLLDLPALRSWPNDAGRFITFGLVLTKHPENNVRNLGVYRMQIIDEKKAIMHWQIHKRGAQHYLMKKEKNEKIEVGVIIGADPATIFAAVAPVPEGLDKYLFAGIVRKKGLRLVKCNTIDLEVPADAEIVLEGYVDPNDIRIEGPFGDHTGYYTPPEPYPTFHLNSIMHRDDPIYHTTVVGKPIVEDAYIGKVIERSFLPLIQMFHPEVIDFAMPAAGWFQGLAIVSIKKIYAGQAKKVMLGLWGLGQLSLTKIIIVVDHDINIHDMNDVIWAITTRVDARRDIIIIDNAPTDTLDPASPLLNLGSKLGIDATQKWKEEGYEREPQELSVVDNVTKELVDRRWKEYNLE
ncbi:MAG: menaquinone biosynthesis decarboxylase [Candidatus Nitrosocaldaceae archaeon]